MVPPSAQVAIPDDGYPRAVPEPKIRGPLAYLRFAGPGFMVAVGYMDPGNWATDLAGGSRYGYQLLSVVIASNVFAMLLQYLSLKLGVAANQDLASATRAYFSRRVSIVLWLISEAGMVACSLAEILGAALALQLLFNIGQPLAVCLAGANMILLLILQRRGVRPLEALVSAMVLLVTLSLSIELFLSRPGIGALASGLLSNPIRTPGMIFLASGIMGATIMPHTSLRDIPVRPYLRNP